MSLQTHTQVSLYDSKGSLLSGNRLTLGSSVRLCDKILAIRLDTPQPVTIVSYSLCCWVSVLVRDMYLRIVFVYEMYDSLIVLERDDM